MRLAFGLLVVLLLPCVQQKVSAQTAPNVPVAVPTAVTIESISPTRALVGTAELTLVVRGSGFTSQSRVHWNGEERPTQRVQDNVLSATLSAADLATGGMSEVRVRDASYVGSGASSNPQPFFVMVNLPALDVVYSEFIGKLLVLGPHGLTGRSATVSVADRETGRLEGTATLAEEVNRLVKSDDGQYVYAFLQPPHNAVPVPGRVRRYTVLSQAPWLSDPLEIAIPGPVNAVAVMPGQPTIVAVAFGSRPATVRLYDGAQPRSGAYITPGGSEISGLAFHGAGTLYAYRSAPESIESTTLVVSLGGLVATFTGALGAQPLGAPPIAVAVLDGVAYLSSGRVVNLSTVTDLERLPFAAPLGVEGIEASPGRIYVILKPNSEAFGTYLAAFDPLTRNPVWGMRLSDTGVIGTGRIAVSPGERLAVGVDAVLYIAKTPPTDPALRINAPSSILSQVEAALPFSGTTLPTRLRVERSGDRLPFLLFTSHRIQRFRLPMAVDTTPAEIAFLVPTTIGTVSAPAHIVPLGALAQVTTVPVTITTTAPASPVVTPSQVVVSVRPDSPGTEFTLTINGAAPSGLLGFTTGDDAQPWLFVPGPLPAGAGPRQAVFRVIPTGKRLGTYQQAIFVVGGSPASDLAYVPVELRVEGEPCSYRVQLTGLLPGATGGMGTASVFAPAGCSWSVRSDSNWIVAAATGNGDGTFTYTAAPNPGGEPRLGQIWLGAQRVFIPQAGNLLATGFEDIPVTNPFADAIRLLRDSGITSGCSQNPNRFCPAAMVTRGMMAAFVTRAQRGGLPMQPLARPDFTDVPETHPFYREIQAVYRAGIVRGCSENPSRFCPDDPVLRDQAAAMIVRRRIGNTAAISAPASPKFNDVPTTHPFFPEIQKLRQWGATDGCSVTPALFCPNGMLTREQAAAIIVRGFAAVPY